MRTMDSNYADFRRSVIAALNVSLQVHEGLMQAAEGRERIDDLFEPLAETGFNAIDVLAPAGFVVGELIDLIRILDPDLDPVEVMRLIAARYANHLERRSD
jgi:hypothetical protein